MRLEICRRPRTWPSTCVQGKLVPLLLEATECAARHRQQEQVTYTCPLRHGIVISISSCFHDSVKSQGSRLAHSEVLLSHGPHSSAPIMDEVFVDGVKGWQEGKGHPSPFTHVSPPFASDTLRSLVREIKLDILKWTGLELSLVAGDSTQTTC